MDRSEWRSYRVSFVERDRIPELKEPYSRTRDDGRMDTVVFDEQREVPFRYLGAQDALHGELLADGELVGEMEYRVQSSLLVTRPVEDPAFSVRAGTTSIAPLTHYSGGPDRSAIWSIITRADEVHTLESFDMHSKETVDLLEKDPRVLAQEFGDHLTSEADLTIDGIRCRFRGNEFIVPEDLSFSGVEPLVSMYEDVRLRQFPARDRELVRDSDGSLKAVKW